MRDPNEPSVHDHNAPYNEIDTIDENGEEITVCGCSGCRRAARLREKNEREGGGTYEEW